MKWNNFYKKKPDLIHEVDSLQDKISMSSNQVIFKINNKHYVGVYTKEYYENDDDIMLDYCIEFPIYSWIPLSDIFNDIKMIDLNIRNGILNLKDLSEEEMKSILWKEIE